MTDCPAKDPPKWKLLAGATRVAGKIAGECGGLGDVLVRRAIKQLTTKALPPMLPEANTTLIFCHTLWRQDRYYRQPSSRDSCNRNSRFDLPNHTSALCSQKCVRLRG